MKNIFDIHAKSDDKDELLVDVDLMRYLSGREMSGSCLLKESMLHVRHSYENESVTTDAMRKGSAADALLFDFLIPARQHGHSLPDAVEAFDAEWPVWEGSRRGKGWDEFYSDHGENYLIETDATHERADILGMLNAVVSDPIAAPYWETGVSQVVTKFTEKGLRFKGRMDWLSSRGIIDLKTTARFSAHHLSRTTFNFGYNVKMALYRRWHSHIVAGDKLPCRLIYVESKAPYDVAVVPIESVILDLAEEKALDQISALRIAIDKDEWPGVANGQEVPLDVPSYEMDEVEWQHVES